MELLRHLAESTAFSAAVWLIALVLRRHHARVRHTLWMAASAKFLVPFSLFVALGGRVAPHHAVAVPPPRMRFVMIDATAPLAYAAAVQAPRPARQLPFAWLLWSAGTAAVLIRWYRRWRSAGRILRESTPVETRLPVATRVSELALEPGVFGVFRPVLVLPVGIGDRLSAEQIDAVIAHEMCHVRHRDNLAAAVHMLVEALFWFHPLVWWIGARLVDERERACDEEVVRLGSDRVVYAESILRVCAFAIEAPAPCVSGITGADLKQRIRHIMSAEAYHELSRTRKLLLAGLGVAALAAPLAVGLAQPPAMRAQPPQTAAPLKFDVAAVKPVDRGFLEIFPQRSGGRIHWSTSIGAMIGYGYNLESWRISGPVPAQDHVFALDATTDPHATEDQVRLMFQSLLIDRFGMVAHRETKEVEGFALTVAKGGLKIPEAREGDKPPDLPGALRGAQESELDGKVLATIQGAGIGALTGRRTTMQRLADGLQRVVRTAVLDQTGLAGRYYFDFQFARENSPDDVNLPDLFHAVQELGLRLERHKGPVEVLVVDHIDKVPNGN